jgi:hypothetical protein
MWEEGLERWAIDEQERYEAADQRDSKEWEYAIGVQMGVMAANHKEVREPTAEGYPPAIRAGYRDARLLLHKVRAAGEAPDDPEEVNYDADLAEIRGEPASFSAVKELQWDLGYYSKNAKSARLRYHTSEVALLVASAAVPITAALASQKWIPAALGAVVVVIVGLRRVYSWHEDWLRFSATYSLLKREQLAFRTGDPRYIRSDRDSVLMNRMMDIEQAETEGWAALRKAQMGQDDK